MSEKENTRLLALEVLLEVEKKNIFVKDALHKLLFQKQFLSKQDRAFVTRIVEGVTEYQVRLDYVINCYSKRKVEKCKPLIRCVLRLGVYQMLYMDSVPNEAACDECVKLTRKKGFGSLSGFVNGVLRNINRHLDDIVYPAEEEDVCSYCSVFYSMPEWLVKCMIEWYGIDQTKQMLAASLETKDLTVRVNTARISKSELVKRLVQKGIRVREGDYVPEALHLEQINYVKRIPGFSEGDFFVQDESSMLVYAIANPKGEACWKGSEAVEKKNPFRILDVCAAPGGKSTHFAQMLGEGAEIEARDLTEKKAALIQENIDRLGLLTVHTVVWDALCMDETKREWADLVIADLPCSGLGIISKKNDIKYRIRQEQLTELVNLQRTILTNAASYVKPGGLLLYSTCTINPQENMENVRWFLEHFDFQKESIERQVPEALQTYILEGHMLQLLPGIVKCDGFFIAKFRKGN